MDRVYPAVGFSRLTPTDEIDGTDENMAAVAKMPETPEELERFIRRVLGADTLAEQSTAVAAKMPETSEELERFVLMVLDKIVSERKVRTGDKV